MYLSKYTEMISLLYLVMLKVEKRVKRRAKEKEELGEFDAAFRRTKKKVQAEHGALHT